MFILWLENESHNTPQISWHSRNSASSWFGCDKGRGTDNVSMPAVGKIHSGRGVVRNQWSLFWLEKIWVVKKVIHCSILQAGKPSQKVTSLERKSWITTFVLTGHQTYEAKLQALETQVSHSIPIIIRCVNTKAICLCEPRQRQRLLT